MSESPLPEDILYFCDESSQLGDRYMAVAGLAIRRQRVAGIVADLRQINDENGVVSEVKWSTAKKRRVSVHALYADYLFRLLKSGQAHVHIRFVPFGEYDHKSSGPRGRIDTVSKMYYQLLLHRAAGFYGKKHCVYVHPDNGERTEQLSMMRNQLCTAAYNKRSCRPNCIRVIEPRDSAREPMLQLLDVTLGALAAVRNEREIGEVKQYLAAHVLQLAGSPDLGTSSPSQERRFNIWNVIPSR